MAIAHSAVHFRRVGSTRMMEERRIIIWAHDVSCQNDLNGSPAMRDAPDRSPCSAWRERAVRVVESQNRLDNDDALKKNCAFSQTGGSSVIMAVPAST